MSTVFYGYRVPKGQLWELIAQVREFYAREHMVASVIRELAANRDPDNEQQTRKLTEFTSSLAEIITNDDLDVQLQLFDEGEQWLLRPLERGYLFVNSYAEQGWPLETVFFDDRTDVPPEAEPLRELMVWVDEQISAQRYLLLDLFSAHDAVAISQQLLGPLLADEAVADDSDDEPDAIYALAKDELWTLADATRAFYRRTHPSAVTINEALADFEHTDESWRELWDLEIALSDELKQEHLEVQLQLFDDGQRWLVRVLEAGQLFATGAQAENWPLERVSDPAVLARVDELIAAQRYLLVSSFSSHDLQDLWWSSMKTNRDQRTETDSAALDNSEH